MIELPVLALYAIPVVVFIIIYTIVLVLFFRARVPGFTTWLIASIKNLPVLINCYMDGYAEYKILDKNPGSIVFNGGTTDEIIDRSMVDNKPMVNLEGKRIMIRVTASAVPNTPDELAEITRVLDHVHENKESLYPLLGELKDFEIFGALGHDPQVARELLAYHCQVEREYVGEDGARYERNDDELQSLIAQRVDGYMAEVEVLRQNIQYLPRRPCYVDLPRAVDATQLRVASQILTRYRAEIEQYYRALFQGQENQFWKGAMLGCLGGGVLVFIATRFIGGG